MNLGAMGLKSKFLNLLIGLVFSILCTRGWADTTVCSMGSYLNHWPSSPKELFGEASDCPLESLRTFSLSREKDSPDKQNSRLRMLLPELMDYQVLIELSEEGLLAWSEFSHCFDQNLRDTSQKSPDFSWEKIKFWFDSHHYCAATVRKFKDRVENFLRTSSITSTWWVNEQSSHFKSKLSLFSAPLVQELIRNISRFALDPADCKTTKCLINRELAEKSVLALHRLDYQWCGDFGLVPRLNQAVFQFAYQKDPTIFLLGDLKRTQKIFCSASPLGSLIQEQPKTILKILVR